MHGTTDIKFTVVAVLPAGVVVLYNPVFDSRQEQEIYLQKF